jgi:cytochrome oxidase Cu insertion factor (SCO1/SenC/PrrC family)
MKSLISITSLVFLLATNCIAQKQQKKDTTYKPPAALPSFNLLLTDSTVFNSAKLKNGQPTIIMYFNPTCHHCTHQTETMLKDIEKMKHIQWVLATYQPLNEIRKFVSNYNLDKYPNIITGADFKYFILPFYQVKSIPHLALYNAKATYIRSFGPNTSVAELLKAFREHEKNK